MSDMGQTDVDAMRKMKSAFDDIKQQLTRVIVGMDDVIEELLKNPAWSQAVTRVKPTAASDNPSADASSELQPQRT